MLGEQCSYGLLKALLPWRWEIDTLRSEMERKEKRLLAALAWIPAWPRCGQTLSHLLLLGLECHDPEPL